MSQDQIDSFEFELLSGAKSVTQEMFESTLQLQNTMRAENPDSMDACEDDSSDLAIEPSYWLPTVSEPGDLYRQYLQLATEGYLDNRNASQELRRWKPPYHLDEASFNEFIGGCMRREPIIKILNQFLALQERRFGEVARFLADELSQDSRGSEEWDVLLEWLLYFLPSEYSYRRNPHSELVQYLGS